ncbi:MAG: IS1595 family transposase [Terriglobia bacterium]|jgi:transposase-like protein
MKNTGLLAPHYRDEDAAREHIEKTRWPDGPVCPHCGVVNEATKLEPREGSKKGVRKGVWNCNACREQFTVTVGSIFEDSHIPLHKWLLAIHLMASSKKGISAHQLMRNLEIGSYRTAWFMAHRIRWALTQEPIKGALQGVVEIDETYIGPKVRGKGVKAGKDAKVPVVSLVERGGRARSYQVERVNARELRPLINEHIHGWSQVMTDDASVYPVILKNRVASHDVVNHSKDEYVRHENGRCITTNSVESFFAIVKRGHYGVYHHWSKKYMGQYLREYDWRYNVRALPDVERSVVALKMTVGKRLVLKPSIGKG